MDERTTTSEVPVPSGYPAAWDADVVLSDGGTVRLRPIRPDDDAHKGRGMATLLLEYLAAAARQAGISAFTATVLPTNQRMVGVFRAAGFQVRSTFDEGVIEVHLDLQPTPEAEAAIEARASRAEAEAVRRLLSPGSVAVIGAGREPTGVGHAVLRNLLAHDFNGHRQVLRVRPCL